MFSSFHVLRNICISNSKFYNMISFFPSFGHDHDLFMEYVDLVFLNTTGWASLIAQLVKNPRSPWSDSWVGKICWGRDRLPTPVFLGFPYGSAGKESAGNVGVLGSIPGLGRSPGEGKGYPLQYSGVENSKGMATHSSTLAWKIPWTEEPGRLQSMGLRRVGHDWVTFTLTFKLLRSLAQNWFSLFGGAMYTLDFK